MNDMSPLFASIPPGIVKSTKPVHTLGWLCHDLKTLLRNGQKDLNISTLRVCRSFNLGAVQGQIKAEVQLDTQLR